MKLDNIRHFAIGKGESALASLRVPHLDVSIERCRQEFGTLEIEGDILDGLRMAHKGSQAIALVVDVP